MPLRAQQLQHLLLVDLHAGLTTPISRAFYPVIIPDKTAGDGTPAVDLRPATASVTRGAERLDHISLDAAARGDLHAVSFRPGAHRGRVNTGERRLRRCSGAAL